MPVAAALGGPPAHCNASERGFNPLPWTTLDRGLRSAWCNRFRHAVLGEANWLYHGASRHPHLLANAPPDGATRTNGNGGGAVHGAWANWPTHGCTNLRLAPQKDGNRKHVSGTRRLWWPLVPDHAVASLRVLRNRSSPVANDTLRLSNTCVKLRRICTTPGHRQETTPAMVRKCCKRMGKYTRRLVNHTRCKNQTPVAAVSLAGIAAAVLCDLPTVIPESLRAVFEATHDYVHRLTLRSEPQWRRRETGSHGWLRQRPQCGNARPPAMTYALPV